MSNLQLFRKRLIPHECIPLKNDKIVVCTDDYIITTWTTLNPKIAFDHGSSCYFLKEGFKLSKFYKQDGSLLYWYCDIVEYEWTDNGRTLIATDLLADVIVYPDGRVKVMDLDELADASASGQVTPEQLQKSLHQLDNLLKYIYTNNFHQLQSMLEDLGL